MEIVGDQSRLKEQRGESGIERIAADAEAAYVVLSLRDAAVVRRLLPEAAVLIIPGGIPRDIPYDRMREHFLWLRESDLPHIAQFRFVFPENAMHAPMTRWLVDHFGIGRATYVPLPARAKNLLGVIDHEGEQHTAGLLMTPIPWPKGFVRTIEELEEGVLALHAKGFTRGLSTGWTAIDPYYTVRPGELTVLTGIPYHGKTFWLTAMMCNLMREFAWRFAIFSPEAYSMEEFIGDMLGHLAYKPFLAGAQTLSMDHGEALKGMSWMRNRVFPIEAVSGVDQLSIPDVLSVARQLHEQYGIEGLVIDPWNKINHERDYQENPSEYISRMLSMLTKFGRQRNMAIWLVAHPTKIHVAQSGDYKGLRPPPSAYDIADSAHFHNIPDNNITLWRNLKNWDEPVELHFQKIKFRQTGRWGMAHLRWNEARWQYESVFNDEAGRFF